MPVNPWGGRLSEATGNGVDPGVQRRSSDCPNGEGSCRHSLVDEVIVVDDGSSDDTQTQAIAAGAFVVALSKNMGKAGAVTKGLNYVSGEVVVLLDGDLTDSAQLADKLITPILQGEADLTVAAWPRRGSKSGFGLVEGFARIAVRLLGGDRLWPVPSRGSGQPRERS